MTDKKPRILFMGTPEFAVPSLELLVEKAWRVIGVVTQPDRPKGRGQRLVASPVKEAAGRHGLTVYQPEKVRAPEFLEIFHGLAPDMVVLVAFGQILPKAIIDGPPLGCINVHPSLLPGYRGAAPINWALIRGDRTTGISIMRMDEGVDSGDILLQEETAIEPGESYDHLHDRLAVLGAQCLLRGLEGLADGTIRRIAQDHSLATFAPRLKKEDGLIRWEAPARQIAHFVAGLSSVPGAYTFLDGKVLKVYSAEAEEAPMCCDTPGTIIGPEPKGLKIAAGGGYVYLKDIQLESKKRMPITDFLRGFRFTPGTKLGMEEGMKV
jgi:methionyl-tRNA formyltransferase